MRVPFPLFWSVALVSNIATGAQGVAVGWILGDPVLPATVLIVYQVAIVGATILGVRVGAVIVRRLGNRRTLVVSALLEAASAVGVLFAVLRIEQTPTSAQAYLLAAVASGAAFGGGIGGPAWMALVAGWPGTRGGTSQLLRDGIQFQLGRFIGPLVGSAALHGVPGAPAWLAAANALSFVVVGGMFAVIRPTERDRAERAAPRGALAALRTAVRSPWLWAVALIAAASDAARLFLPRLIQSSGEGELIYGATLAALAAAAAVAAGFASRLESAPTRIARGGAALVTAGLVVWALAPMLGGFAWIAGAVLLGAGAATSTPAITAAMMAAAGPRKDAAAAASVMVTRTAAGGLGALALGLFVPLIGSLALLVGAVGAGIATSLAGGGSLGARERSRAGRVTGPADIRRRE